MTQPEKALVEQRIRDCFVRMRRQRTIIASLKAGGRDSTIEVNLLSAMESSQAMRLRRLASLVS